MNGIDHATSAFERPDPLRAKAGRAVRVNDPALVVIAHPTSEMLGSRFHLLEGGDSVLGRSPESQVFLGDVASMSRCHAAIWSGSEGVWLRDLGSTNGTYLNDRRIDGRVELSTGDRIQLGVVHVKFLLRPDVESAYHETMYALASTDGLTGLANRRRFDEELPRELVRAQRYGRPFTLLLIDVDRFKSINDEFGHVAGDAALRHVAGVCREATRREQCIARLGGDEIAILCPETTAADARFLAERIRRCLDETRLLWEGREIHATISAGIAELGAEDPSPDGIYRAADAALYRAKELGRDRVTVRVDAE